jgi:hypothetical protein
MEISTWILTIKRKDKFQHKIITYNVSEETKSQEEFTWIGFNPHYAINRQVAVSIPDGVIGIFQWHDPSGRTMALGSTQPLTEMSTRCISWG